MYDLTDYMYTLDTYSNDDQYNFLDEDITDVFSQQTGQDITKQLQKVLDGKDSGTVQNNMDCLNNAFYVGKKDFRYTARCQAQNYILLVISGILMVSMLLKCAWAVNLPRGEADHCRSLGGAAVRWQAESGAAG